MASTDFSLGMSSPVTSRERDLQEKDDPVDWGAMGVETLVYDVP